MEELEEVVCILSESDNERGWVEDLVKTRLCRIIQMISFLKKKSHSTLPHR